MRVPIAPLAMLLLASCQSAPAADDPLAVLEGELAAGQSANAVDPAILAALADPIMVDPWLAGHANADMLRPPTSPYAAVMPHPAIAAGRTADIAPETPAATDTGNARADALTLDALIATLGPAAARCASGGIEHSAVWANRLPQVLALHPDARVTEAAGRDVPGCSLRAASFFVAAPAGSLIAWYRARAAGFALTEGTDGATRILSGTRAGAAFGLYVTSLGDGSSDIDLVFAAS